MRERPERSLAPGLRIYRDARGGTAEEEAALTGVTWRTWMRWEHGEATVPVSTLESIARRWGVTAAVLMRAQTPGPDAAVRRLLEEHGSVALRAAARRVIGGL